MFIYVQERNLDPVEEPKRKEREPSSYLLRNPERLVPSQVPYSTVVEGQRYTPVDHRMVHPTGIIMLIDCDPEAPQDVAKGMGFVCVT